MFDLIGDIHGYAHTLRKLLEKLGYVQTGEAYTHPIRKVIFLGDFIDRGPRIRETLQIVAKMVENGSAYAVMGNHEFNAILYFLKDNRGCWIGDRSAKKLRNLEQTILQFKNNTAEWEQWLEWFKKLPLFLDLKILRVVHACWDSKAIETTKQILLPNNALKSLFFLRNINKNDSLFKSICILLKGKEINLPGKIPYHDKDGIPRWQMRVKWWVKPSKKHTYSQWSVNLDIEIPKIVLPSYLLDNEDGYASDLAPVFIGHYWQQGKPEALAPNVCCLDYSIAKGGFLVAYPFDGESIIDNSKFVLVENAD